MKKYLCLVYGEEAEIARMDDHECLAYDRSLLDSGRCVSSEALEPVSTAATVRVRHGKLSVSDGPFAETKEQLGGFYLVEARDLNEAIQLAARIPWHSARSPGGPTARAPRRTGRAAPARPRPIRALREHPWPGPAPASATE